MPSQRTQHARSRHRIEGTVVDDLYQLTARHPDWNAGAIHRELNGRYGVDLDTKPLDQVVSLRTVQRAMRATADASGPWTMDDRDFEPEDVPLVLDVVARADRVPSRAVARWIVRIRRAYPDLADLDLIYLLASVARRGGGQLANVERFLSYRPWLDDCRALADAYARRVVGFDVLFMGGCEGAAPTADLRARGYEMRDGRWQRKEHRDG